jgi:hypothetical protein
MRRKTYEIMKKNIHLLDITLAVRYRDILLVQISICCDI